MDKPLFKLGHWASAALFLALLALSYAAHAQSLIGQPIDCSGTVGTASAAISFSHPPGYYVIINNPSATATLAINPNGAAVVNASGSITINPTGVANDMIIWSAGMGMPVPQTINIIASAVSTPYTCKFQ